MNQVIDVVEAQDFDEMCLDLLGDAWGVIANAGGGNWLLESKEWQGAAERWRDAYHKILATPRIIREI